MIPWGSDVLDVLDVLVVCQGGGVGEATRLSSPSIRMGDGRVTRARARMHADPQVINKGAKGKGKGQGKGPGKGKSTWTPMLRMRAP